MKKISIRSLFIVILALVLVFALVACGNKDDNKGGGGGGQTTPPNDVTNVKNYFNTLWEKSTGIGGEAIGEKDDLKVSLDLAVALDLVDRDGQGYDKLDLGIALELVLDRSSGTDKSTNTAIKAKIYDPSNGENWFTAYYFFNDVDNIYIDYAGQNVKIPFSYLNDTYNKNFYNFIFNDKIVKGKSIAEVVTALTKNMGSKWDLNVLIGDVMKVFNVDVAKFKDTISGVLGFLPNFNVDDAFDAQGNLNIKNILTNETVAGLFANNETTTVTEGDVTTYTTKLASSTLEILSAFSGSLPAGLMDVIEDLDLTLQFTTKNDAIDSFTIKVGLPALEGEKDLQTYVHPVVAITINELDFAKAREGEIENAMAVKRDNYKTEAVIDAEVAVDLKGITLNALAFDKEGYARFSKVNEAIKKADPTIKKGLEEIVLDDIRTMAQRIVLDEKAIREEYLRRNAELADAAIKKAKKELQSKQKRSEELTRLIKTAYEDKVKGKIPEDICIGFIEDYSAEQKTIAVEIESLEKQLSETETSRHTADDFIRDIKKYLNAPELTREMCYELIDRIIIGGSQSVTGKEREIEIVYKIDISSVLRHRLKK